LASSAATIKRRRKCQTAPGDDPKRQIDIAVPVFGYKNHVGIDREHGFLRRYMVTHAAVHDGGQLAGVLDHDNTDSDVLADTAYRSTKSGPARESRPQAATPAQTARGKQMPAHIGRGYATRARVRSRVEHVLAVNCSRSKVLKTTHTVCAMAPPPQRHGRISITGHAESSE